MHRESKVCKKHWQWPLFRGHHYQFKKTGCSKNHCRTRCTWVRSSWTGNTRAWRCQAWNRNQKWRIFIWTLPFLNRNLVTFVFSNSTCCTGISSFLADIAWISCMDHKWILLATARLLDPEQRFPTQIWTQTTCWDQVRSCLANSCNDDKAAPFTCQ